MQRTPDASCASIVQEIRLLRDELSSLRIRVKTYSKLVQASRGRGLPLSGAGRVLLGYSTGLERTPAGGGSAYPCGSCIGRCQCEVACRMPCHADADAC